MKSNYDVGQLLLVPHHGSGVLRGVEEFKHHPKF
jgi:hypothetical protein